MPATRKITNEDLSKIASESDRDALVLCSCAVNDLSGAVSQSAVKNLQVLRTMAGNVRANAFADALNNGLVAPLDEPPGKVAASA